MSAPPTGYSSSVYSPELQPKEDAFVLYAHHISEGNPLANTREIGGENWVINFTVFDGPNPGAKPVARLQGIHYPGIKFSNVSVEFVFTDDRFPSTLKFAGHMENDSELAIVGGTGKFALAQGIIKHRAFQPSGPRIREFKIRAMVPTLRKTVAVTKDGPWPWGGDSGRQYDIIELPLDLESVTIGSGDAIDSLAFSYIDQAGTKRTVGPWGGNGGTKNTITLAHMEKVTKMEGTTGKYNENIVVRSISFSTNLMRTYGPFGIETGDKFNTAAGDNIIVGFYARAGPLLNSIGVYVRKN